MQPTLSRYQRTRLRVREKRSQWKESLYKAGDLAAFMLRFFREAVKPPYEFREILYQCYLVGYKSTFLIGLTAFIMGAVLTIQTRPSMASFGAISLIPGMVSVSVVREIGPVITAIICAGKIGSRMGAELGSMRVTEQIDAMEVSAINPYKYLVISRVMATTITVPVLGLYCGFVALLGSFLNVHMHESTSFISFFEYGFETISFLDVFTSVVKSIFFGFTIGMVGCYKGFNATN